MTFEGLEKKRRINRASKLLILDRTKSYVQKYTLKVPN